MADATDRSWLEQYSCKSKMRFRKRRTAAKRAAITMREENVVLVPYHCQYCGYHHLHTSDAAPRPHRVNMHQPIRRNNVYLIDEDKD